MELTKIALYYGTFPGSYGFFFAAAPQKKI